VPSPQPKYAPPRTPCAVGLAPLTVARSYESRALVVSAGNFLARQGGSETEQPGGLRSDRPASVGAGRRKVTSVGSPYNPQQYPGQQPGQYPAAGYGQPVAQPTPPAVPQYGQPVPGMAPQWAPPAYGAPRPGINLAALGTTKLAAIVVAAAGLIVLFGSLLSLYSVTVTPSAASVPDNDAPLGQINVGIGFYDVMPIFAPPIVAQAVPVLMVLAALCAAPVIFGADRKTAPLAAVFAGTGTLLALMLTISSPLPSVELTGQMAAKFENNVGNQTIDDLVNSVASVGPGAGLLIALVFGALAWGAAVMMVFKRNAPGPQPGRPGHPGQTGQHGPGVPPAPRPW
jgi:hypothetical protein